MFNYLSLGTNILIGFVLTSLILRFSNYEVLGNFGIFFSLKSLLDIGIGWITSGITKNLINYKHLKTNIYTVSKILNLLFGILIILFFAIYGIFNSKYLISSLLFGLGNFIAFILTPYYEIFISELKQSVVAIFRFIQQFLFFIFSVSLFYFFKKLEFVFLGMVIGNTITFILVSFYFKSYYNLPFDTKFFNRILKRLFTKEISIFFNGLSTVLLLQIDILLIYYLYGEKSAGIYLVIFKIPNTLIMLGWRLSEPFSAIVSKEIKINKRLVYEKFKKLEKNLLVISLLFATFYLIFGRYILYIWIGRDNIPNIQFMYIIPSAVLIFSIMQRLYLSVNYLTYGLNTITVLQFIEIIFKIIFTVFLFSYFKELSPVAGWLFAFFFTIWLYRKNALKILKD